MKNNILFEGAFSPVNIAFDLEQIANSHFTVPSVQSVDKSLLYWRLGKPIYVKKQEMFIDFLSQYLGAVVARG